MFDSAHKIMTILMAAGIGWMVTTVNDAAKDIAVLKVKVEAAVSDRYTAKNALADYALIERKFLEHERRLDAIEKKVDK